MIRANGKAPIKTSDSEISGSFKELWITKQETPKGGVSRPISAPMTVTIPNHTKLMSMGSKMGRKSGTMMRMMETVSKIVPMRTKRMTYISMIVAKPNS